jgi:hypothetical protein
MNKAITIDDKKHSPKQPKKQGNSLQREVIGEMLKELDSEITKLMIEQNNS